MAWVRGRVRRILPKLDKFGAASVVDRMASAKDRPGASKLGLENGSVGSDLALIHNGMLVSFSGAWARADELFQTLLTEYDPISVAEIVIHAVERNLARSKKPQSALAAAMIRGVAARQTIKEEAGGGISAEDARRFLGNISRQAVLYRFRKGRLLGWREARQNAVRFPVWQFSEQGGMQSGIEEVLEILLSSTAVDEWGAILFFLNRRSSLNDKRPLDALRSGQIDEVKCEAHAYVAS
jgi:hypothetical protein